MNICPMKNHKQNPSISKPKTSLVLWSSSLIFFGCLFVISSVLFVLYDTFVLLIFIFQIKFMIQAGFYLKCCFIFE